MSSGAWPIKSRLPWRHTSAIRDVAFGVEEADAGLCTRYLVDEHLGGGGSEDAVRLFDADRALDAYEVFDHGDVAKWRAEIKRARRALAALQQSGQGAHAAVLRIAYGPEDPSTRTWPAEARHAFGRELVGLVRYTDAVEEVRLALVRSGVWARCRQEAGAAAALVRSGRPVPPLDLRLVRSLERTLERSTTSGDALREVFRPFSCRPDLASKERATREAAHRERLRAFLELARSQADRMLAAAGQAYHAAWLANGG